MPTDAYTTQLAALRTLGGRRVWSLMISLFGDLAQDEGQAIDGPVLSDLMGAMQVKPEAVRVALHRLRIDGWITSTRAGRISRHALTAQGRAQSRAASPRIYAPPEAAEDAWQIIVTAGGAVVPDAGFAPIAPRIYVGPGALGPPRDALVFQGSQVPDWLRKQAAPTHLRADYEALLEILTALAQTLPEQPTFTAKQTAVLRCLIVHNWRRLVLKHASLPAALVSPKWPGQRCHVLVSQILADYPRPTLAHLKPTRAD